MKYENGFPDLINKAVKEIVERRTEIIEQFAKTWLATNISDENLNPKWIVNNLALVEKQTSEGLKMWFEYRDKLFCDSCGKK